MHHLSMNTFYGFYNFCSLMLIFPSSLEAWQTIFNFDMVSICCMPVLKKKCCSNFNKWNWSHWIKYKTGFLIHFPCFSYFYTCSSFTVFSFSFNRMIRSRFVSEWMFIASGVCLNKWYNNLDIFFFQNEICNLSSANIPLSCIGDFIFHIYQT